MKKLNLYYVFDNLGETQIAGPIPCANDLVACIGFRDTYINEKDPRKNPYNYKALDLVRFARLAVDEDGCFTVCNTEPDLKISRICGKDVISTIAALSAELGIEDDDLVDSQPEEK